MKRVGDSKKRKSTTTNILLNQDFGTWELDGIYKDTGCPVYTKCLKCPLPQCIYDSEPSKGAIKGYSIMASFYPYVQLSEFPEQLSELANISVRSAQRLLKRYREADGDYGRFIGVI